MRFLRIFRNHASSLFFLKIYPGYNNRGKLIDSVVPQLKKASAGIDCFFSMAKNAIPKRQHTE